VNYQALNIDKKCSVLRLNICMKLSFLLNVVFIHENIVGFFARCDSVLLKFQKALLKCSVLLILLTLWYFFYFFGHLTRRVMWSFVLGVHLFEQAFKTLSPLKWLIRFEPKLSRLVLCSGYKLWFPTDIKQSFIVIK
jgi:hypothetical protein